jgi:hypothetical protein
MIIGRNIPIFKRLQLFYHKWTEANDKQLLEMFEEYGPSWTLISFKFPNRTPVEVRRRFLKLTDAFEPKNPLFEKPSNEDAEMLRSGWDKTCAGDWIKIPLDTIGPSPYSHLTQAVPKYKNNKSQKFRNWQDIEEKMAVWFGAIQFQGDFEKVASKLKRRTAVQCQNFVYDKLSFLIPCKENEEIEAIRKKLTEGYILEDSQIIEHQCR